MTQAAAASPLMDRPERSSFRYWIMIIVCVAWGSNYMCRTNLGLIIPSLKAEFGLSNVAAGSIAGVFFLGYMAGIIPSAFVLSKYGPRKFIATTIFIFSGITAAMGAAGSALQLKILRVLLGIAESPTPIGVTATLKNWFPPEERGRAMGVFAGLSAIGMAIAAPVTVWLIGMGGWRWGFYGMAIPGVVIGIIWLIFVRAFPHESSFCSQAEVDHITASQCGRVKLRGSLGWLDKCLRLREIAPIEKRYQVFVSKNVLTMAVIYATATIITYGMATWVPSFLVSSRHYSFVKMGWVAAAPGLGGFLGDLVGGWLQDKIMLNRLKPMVLIATLATALFMWAIIHAPDNAPLLAFVLFSTGFVFHLGYPAYFAYNMSITNTHTYPISHSVTSMVGNFGSFLSPIVSGFLIDVFHNYEVVFLFMGGVSILGFLLTAFVLDEPSHPA